MTPHPPLRGPPSPTGEGSFYVRSPEKIIVSVYCLSRDVEAPSPTILRSHARGNYRLRVTFADGLFVGTGGLAAARSTRVLTAAQGCHSFRLCRFATSTVRDEILKQDLI